jgi:dihydrofolate reductase
MLAVMKNTLPLCLIAALAENRVIGRDNQLPWHLPADLKHFKALTLGKPIIMGRKTFDSLGRPLPGRTNIVVTNQAGLQLPGAVVVNSLEDALTAAQNQALLDDVDEVMVIGGEKIYRQCLKLADRLYLTLVEAEPEGDAWFPPFDADAWTLVETREVAAGDGYPAHAYQVLDRAAD